MTEVRLERTLTAPPEKVYAAWTDAALMGRWLCPNPALEVRATADAVVGGRYRVDMGAGTYVVEGAFLELDPPRVVVVSWRWTTSDEPATTVRVELAPTADGGTHLVLLHTGLVDADDAQGHAEGWELSLDRLADAV